MDRESSLALGPWSRSSSFVLDEIGVKVARNAQGRGIGPRAGWSNTDMCARAEHSRSLQSHPRSYKGNDCREDSFASGLLYRFQEMSCNSLISREGIVRSVVTGIDILPVFKLRV